MSASHHSPAEIEAQQRMLNEFLGNAKPRFPNGQLNPDDQGELAFAVGIDPAKKVVVLRFSKAVDWIGLGREETLHLCNLLIEKAAQLPNKPESRPNQQ